MGRIHLSFTELVNSLKGNQEVHSTQTNLEDASTKEQDNCLNVRIFLRVRLIKKRISWALGASLITMTEKLLITMQG